MVYAGFWRRVAAFLIDALILVIPAVLVNFALTFFGTVVVAFLYKPFFESSELMGTPGKVFMGLAVTNEAGQRLTFKTAMLRWVLSWVSQMMMGLGYLFNLFTAKRQTFHDIMAGTVVIHRAPVQDPDWIGVWLRNFRAVCQLPPPGSPPPGSVNADHDALNTLENLHKLFQQGAITEAEYLAKKEELLKKI